ncbi:large ribosomal RNA subunit accumulation protein YCED homolog 1, chloroplastic [Solanum lycopersicum]|uniref:Uncharacterized protein n=1 Tax=Solanum lycopersicum TaxID=4081 RepID=A0A3Q7EW48_SOLLC|nr:large ribosomal RNA subunit accumulation protein YCED homolog 1, chloroplastic [Solanum lycopersicum]
MSVVLSTSVLPLCGSLNPENVQHITKVRLNPWKICNLNFRKKGLKFVVREQKSNFVDFDWEDEYEDEYEDEDSPWEGAVVYKRNSSVTHLDYYTTLERLGLGKLSTKVSKCRASVMGLRVTRQVKDYPDGTPVLISFDVTRMKHKLRLDGIIRTVIALPCNRCGEPAAESIFSNFSLLLSEEPLKEAETLDMGIMFGDDKFKSFVNVEEEMEENDGWIPLEDQLYFPGDEKMIDISKHIRDLVHIEITINAVCDPKCKGLCLKCGANLNVNRCSCHMEKIEEKGYGPLGGLKKQMQQT